MKEGRLLVRKRVTDFIRLFSKTPRGIVCPNFFMLAHSNGCPYDCDFCYLLNTLRHSDTNEIFSNYDRIEEHVKAHLKLGISTVLNAGELTDSLAWKQNREVALKLIELYRNQKEDLLVDTGAEHILLFVSKSDKVEDFMDVPPTDSVIFSFSINRDDIAKEYEQGAAEPKRRLAAAAFLQSKGWRIRLRIDPMLHHPDEEWPDTISKYVALVDLIAKAVKPERITLGSLRIFQTLEYYTTKEGIRLFAHAFNQGDPDRRKRYDLEKRTKLYAEVIKAIMMKFETEVGLCKETKIAWDVTRDLLGNKWLDPERPKCNCSM